MVLYSGDADVVVEGEVVTRVIAHLHDESHGKWQGRVRAAGGESEAPAQIESVEQWVLRLDDGREATVTSSGYVLMTSHGLDGLKPWETGVDGVGDFPS